MRAYDCIGLSTTSDAIIVTLHNFSSLLLYSLLFFICHVLLSLFTPLYLNFYSLFLLSSLLFLLSYSPFFTSFPCLLTFLSLLFSPLLYLSHLFLSSVSSHSHYLLPRQASSAVQRERETLRNTNYSVDLMDALVSTVTCCLPHIHLYSFFICPVLSCPVLSCPVLSCHVLCYLILSYPTLTLSCVNRCRTDCQS